MRGKNPHDSRRSAILGRREEALPPAAPRPMRRIVMRALSSSASVSREKGPGGRRGGANAIRNGERSRYKGPRLSVAAPPADRLRTAIRLSPHVPADPYTVVRQNPSTDQRSRNCPSHERFYPHCVRSPSTPAAKQARSIRRQRRTGDFSARKIPKSEFVRRSAAAGPTRAPGDGPATATGTRRTSGFAVAMSNKLQKNHRPALGSRPSSGPGNHRTRPLPHPVRRNSTSSDDTGRPSCRHPRNGYRNSYSTGVGRKHGKQRRRRRTSKNRERTSLLDPVETELVI